MSGPIVSGFLGEAEGWRWIEGVMAIFTGVLWILCSVTIPETYAPVLLRIRAAKLSKLTGKVYVSKLDIGKDRVTVLGRLRLSLSRPWKLLFREPIVFLVSIYMAIVYGTLYMMFAAFPIIFQLEKGWSVGLSGLAFMGILVGMVFAIAYAMLDNIRYTRIAKATEGLVPPEARLPGAIVGSILLPIGLFWFAWTDGNNVHWVVPIVGSVFFATGLVLVFLSLLNYLIDACKFAPILTPFFPLGTTKSNMEKCRCCIRRLSACCKCRPSISLRRRLPPLHAANVRKSRHPLGRLHPSLPIAGLYPLSHHFLEVRPQDPRPVQVRRRGRARVGGDARHEPRGR